MMRICGRCQQIVNGRCPCIKDVARGNSKYRHNKHQRKQYGYARWKKLRGKVFARDNGSCVQCGKMATDVDHILPVRDRPELFYVMDNLQSLCHECHSRKTMQGD